MLVLTLASLPVMLRDRVDVRPTRAQWAGVAWLGIGDALNVVLFFAAYQRTTVAIAVLTHYLTPIFVALLAPVVLKERAGPRTFAAVGVAFLGLVLLLQPWAAAVGKSALVGAALGAGSAVFYASNVLVNKRLVGASSGSELMFFHGLVGTPSDFGAMGERPSNPDLLDWLAAEFMENGWSLKQLHRLILTSTAYRQSSSRNPPGNERDSENRLYWRKPIQ